ncbi:hypothetical protein E2C01_054358 [Portunus trituberculatus]|uniref:Uncharacterized protein n=1 Tax=Portunus trituberculatus TaxID=210409 RepID=A0A5B7GRR7_PORTR|nr:hypothetical protein [Portunus trituberculatus]
MTLECPLVRLSPPSVSVTRSCLSIFSIQFTNLYIDNSISISVFHMEDPLFLGSSL